MIKPATGFASLQKISRWVHGVDQSIRLERTCVETNSNLARGGPWQRRCDLDDLLCASRHSHSSLTSLQDGFAACWTREALGKYLSPEQVTPRSELAEFDQGISRVSHHLWVEFNH